MKRFIAVLRGPDHVFEFVNSAHSESFGQRNILGKARADVYPELNDQGFAEAPQRAYRTGQTVFMRDKTARFDQGYEPSEKKIDISYEPMFEPGGKVSGLLVQGHDLTKIGSSPLEKRALDSGFEVLTDTELLTLYLYHGTLDADSWERAEHLLRRFGDLNGVLTASLDSLNQIVQDCQSNIATSIPSPVAVHLKLTREIGRRILFNRAFRREVLPSTASVKTYLGALLRSEPRERFLVIFLDNRNGLIALEAMGEGTTNRAPVYSREVVRRCLELSATSIILVHNHPSGDPTISAQDLTATQDIERAAQVLDIRVLDHLLVAGENIVSFSERRLLQKKRSR